MTKQKLRQTHTQITAGLRAFAKQEKLAVNAVYSRFFREVFLAELMNKDAGWVLKGGTNLYCLIPGARYTEDLDLYRQDSPTGHRDAAETLMSVMDQMRVGPYAFEVHSSREDTISGTIGNIQLTAIVYVGTGEFSRFNIDVSGDLMVPTVTEPLMVKRSDPLDVPFVAQEFAVWSYPVESQLADKVCAMYESYGSGVSTRYRDLYDIGLIALELEVNVEKLRTALRTQQQVRAVELPLSMVVPGEKWLDGYVKFLGTLRQPRTELSSLENSLAIASELLDPILVDLA